MSKGWQLAKPYFVEERGCWVIQIGNGFLHWIESTAPDEIVTVGDPKFARVSFDFRQQVDAMIEWLQGPQENTNDFTVIVDTDKESEFREQWKKECTDE